MKELPSVRPSPIAGSWYPGNKDALHNAITQYLEDAALPAVEGKVFGLIAPHAGYFYSGSTAGYAYRCVQGESYDVCAVFSPLHDYQPFDFLTTLHTAYNTPLGDVPVSTRLVNEINEDLQTHSNLFLQRIGLDREHSLEIQLPFLQEALKDSFELVPIMVRTHNSGILQKTAKSIARVFAGKRVLIIASTDLSHFYTQRVANQFDQVMTSHFTNFDPQGVLDAEANQQGFACGAGAVALAMWTTQLLGAKNVTLLHHTTSAKASGDTSSVVGYAAAAITG
jgi:MEMO1 family protein